MKNLRFPFSRPPLALLGSLLFAVTLPLLAADTMSEPSGKHAAAPLHYLAPGQLNPAALLPAPPAPGSAEQAADMETVRSVYHAASEADKIAAYAEKEFTVFNFTPAVGAFFTETNLPRTAAFFAKVHEDADTLTGVGKNFFQRPRPFTTDPSLANGKLEKSFSYPSGHSTEATTLALVLAELLPEKADAILAHGRLMGWHRVQIARHYPTDIYAGRVLAQAIVAEFKKSDAFKNEFADARAELKAVLVAAKN
jgi:acid phosphatase (class A)